MTVPSLSRRWAKAAPLLVLALFLALAACGGGHEPADSSPDDSRSLASPQDLTVSYATKTYRLGWDAIAGATHYQLLEDPDGPGPAPEAQWDADLVDPQADVVHSVPLHQRLNATYRVRACNADGCSAPSASLRPDVNQAIGSVLAGNAGNYNLFGNAVALSGDGSLLAVGAPQENGGARGVFDAPTPGDESRSSSGAVYLFAREAGVWRQLAYLKASDAQAGARFGQALALSRDGLTLAVSAPSDDIVARDAGAVYVFSRQSGVWQQQQQVLRIDDGTANDAFGTGLALSADGTTLVAGAPWRNLPSPVYDGHTLVDAGELYVFTRGDADWSLQARVAANAVPDRAHLGASLALSADGHTLAAGAPNESSGATRIDGDESDTSANGAGAAFVFTRSGTDWTQQAYVKGSLLQPGDAFGTSVALSGSGDVLAVGAVYESRASASAAPGSAVYSGAAYTFSRNGGAWSERAYLKASNAQAGDLFGGAVALSADGTLLVVGATDEQSRAVGIGGDETDNSLDYPGAAYAFVQEDASWRPEGYLKASNTQDRMTFASSLSLSADGSSLAIGAVYATDGSAGAPETGAVYLY